MQPPDRAHIQGLTPGLEGHASTIVTDEMTAPAVRSGTIAVYATPCLVALMEQAAVACVEPCLDPGQASLGINIAVDHTAPTLPGQAVSAQATLTAVDGRKLTIAIEARNAAGPIGSATHTRVVVDAARFAARLAKTKD